MSIYSNRGRYQRSHSPHWIWVVFLVVNLLLCGVAGVMIYKLWSDARAQRVDEPPVTRPSSAIATQPTDPSGESEPTFSVGLELELPDAVELLAPAVAVDAAVLPEELVAGLEGTGITVAFEREPEQVTGVQEVTLIFSADGKSCVRQTALYRFELSKSKTVDMLDGHVSDVRDFLADESLEAHFAEGTVTLNRCGEVALTLVCDGRAYPVTYVVAERIAPVGIPAAITAQAGTLPEPSRLLESIIDDSEVTVTWAEVPELTTVGPMTVTVLLTDAYGNTATVESQIIVIPNVNAPQFTGLEELKITVGDVISYKNGVTAVDPQDGEVKFTVDATGFDRNTLGTYTVYYIASDSDGNTTIMPRTVMVQEIGQAEVEARARAALDTIITEDMTRDGMIYAVWYYSLTHVKYVGSSDKSGIIPAAFEGFTTGQGDCYTYYAMNVVMLNMLGIENVEVRRVGGISNHWWNLVKFEDGLWYHLDSCPSRTWLDEVNKAKMTETDLLVFTNHPEVAERLPNYYIYDHTLPQYEGLDIAP